MFDWREYQAPLALALSLGIWVRTIWRDHYLPARQEIVALLSELESQITEITDEVERHLRRTKEALAKEDIYRLQRRANHTREKLAKRLGDRSSNRLLEAYTKWESELTGDPFPLQKTNAKDKLEASHLSERRKVERDLQKVVDEIRRFPR